MTRWPYGRWRAASAPEFRAPRGDCARAIKSGQLPQNAELWIYLDLSPDLAVLRCDVSRAGWKVGMSGSLKEQAWGADGDAPPLDCWSIAGPSRGLRAWAGRSPLRHSGCVGASSALTAVARPPLNTTSAAAEFGISPLRLSSDSLWDRQFPPFPYGTATAQSLVA